jgi:hypothetical protein
MTIFPLGCVYTGVIHITIVTICKFCYQKGFLDSSQIHAHKTESKLKKKELLSDFLIFYR